VDLSRIRDALLPRPRRDYPLYENDELQMLRQATAFNAQLMDVLREHVRPGITTNELDRLAASYTRDHGHVAACLGSMLSGKKVCVDPLA